MKLILINWFIWRLLDVIPSFLMGMALSPPWVGRNDISLPRGKKRWPRISVDHFSPWEWKYHSFPLMVVKMLLLCGGLLDMFVLRNDSHYVRLHSKNMFGVRRLIRCIVKCIFATLSHISKNIYIISTF